MALSAAVLSTGCNGIEEPKSFLDPTQVGRLKSEPLVVPILNNLNIGADEDDVSYGGSRDVVPEDLVASPTDYVISPNDTLSVQVSDLVAPGTVTERSIRVTQTGRISLQLLPQPVRVEGLTEQQVERAIADAYRDAQVLVNNPQVSVSVIEARGRTYTVRGAVANQGTFGIYDKDFRLLDALTVAQTGAGSRVETVYVIRRKKDAAATPAEPATGTPGTTPAPGIDPLAPRSMANPLPRRSVMLAQDGQAPQGGIVVVEGQEVTVNQPPSATTEPSAMPTAEPTPAGAGTTGMGTTGTGEAFEFNALKEPEDREIIRVPYQALEAGQLKYNIVVLPGDFIIVPASTTGEYYMGGNVASSGAYSLPAGKITLAQAIIAARGFNEVAWPSRTEIIRRLPGDKQVFVRVDLDKIFAGQEPDIYLKANDRVQVGTNIIAPFLAAIRNGFRISYGFGWIYDRNYGDETNNGN
ncbi:MAG: polysaccharide biosynthesis/export family protein [Burkholderiales bacterium]|nr:polysaccharide biosynthesis/export family protein [Phycisphaerae bacterium]